MKQERVTNTAGRLQEIMKERGLRQIDLLEKCEPFAKRYGVKINKVAIHNYVIGKVLPKQDKLLILGMALNVNEAWLMGFDVPRERKNPVDYVVKDGDAELLVEVQNLNSAQKDLLRDYIALLKKTN